MMNLLQSRALERMRASCPGQTRPCRRMLLCKASSNNSRHPANNHWPAWNEEDEEAFRPHPDRLRYVFWLPGHLPSRTDRVLKLVECDLDNKSVKWEAEGVGDDRTVQVDCNSSAHLLSVSAYRPGPVELAVEVMAPFGKVKDTRLALMVPTIDMLGAVDWAHRCASRPAEFMQRVQYEIDQGLHEQPKWHGRVLALAEAAAEATDPAKTSDRFKMVHEAFRADQEWVTVPIGHVHIPADTSLAALWRIAEASWLSPKEGAARLQPPQPISRWLAAQKALQVVGAP